MLRRMPLVRMRRCARKPEAIECCMYHTFKLNTRNRSGICRPRTHTLMPIQFLQIICTLSVMAVLSFCHLEEPVPQNNDLKKAHLFARKSLHLGNRTDAAKRCFVKFSSTIIVTSTTSCTWTKLGFPQSINRVLYLKSKKTVSFIAACCGLTSYWTTESWSHQSWGCKIKSGPQSATHSL
ncbi:uncharacterized protein VSU04_009880 [Chlamydotis macqueenii]